VSIKLCKIVFITRPKYQEMSVDYKTIKNQFCQNLKKKISEILFCSKHSFEVLKVLFGLEAFISILFLDKKM